MQPVKELHFLLDVNSVFLRLSLNLIGSTFGAGLSKLLFRFVPSSNDWEVGELETTCASVDKWSSEYERWSSMSMRGTLSGWLLIVL